MSTTSLFTLEDYDHMIACGAFVPPHHRRCELIRGEIRDKSPIGPEHGEAVSFLTDWSYDVTSRRNVRIRIQSSIGIPHIGSAPEPDVVWAVQKSYLRHRPEPSEVLLLIEVAESSLPYDLGDKAALYAEAGVRDYWVVDLPNHRIHVHRDPTAHGFLSVERFSSGDSISPLSDPEAALEVASLFMHL